jgi:hypothetical protein
VAVEDLQRHAPCSKNHALKSSDRGRTRKSEKDQTTDAPLAALQQYLLHLGLPSQSVPALLLMPSVISRTCVFITADKHARQLVKGRAIKSKLRDDGVVAGRTRLQFTGVLWDSVGQLRFVRRRLNFEEV